MAGKCEYRVLNPYETVWAELSAEGYRKIILSAGYLTEDVMFISLENEAIYSFRETVRNEYTSVYRGYRSDKANWAIKDALSDEDVKILNRKTDLEYIDQWLERH